MVISSGSTPLALPGGNPATRRGGPLMVADPPPRPKRFKRRPPARVKAFPYKIENPPLKDNNK